MTGWQSEQIKAFENLAQVCREVKGQTPESDLTIPSHAPLQVIVENIRSMRRTLSEIEQCWPDLGLPRGAEDTLTVFQRAQSLQQPMQELEQRTQEQSARLEASFYIVPPFGIKHS